MVSADMTSMMDLKKELKAVQEQFVEEMSESANGGLEPGIVPERSIKVLDTIKDEPRDEEPRKKFTTPEYDLRVDVYSWAMVYYEVSFLLECGLSLSYSFPISLTRAIALNLFY